MKEDIHRVCITFYSSLTFDGAQKIGLFPRIRDHLNNHSGHFGEVYILTMDDLSFNGFFQNENVRHIPAFPFRLPLILRLLIYPLLGMMFLSIYERRYDVILATPYSIHAVLPSKIFNKPLVVHYKYDATLGPSRNRIEDLKKGLIRLLNVFLLRNADKVAVTTHRLKEEAEKIGVSPHHIYRVPNYVNTQSFSPDVDGSGIKKRMGILDKKALIYIGRLVPFKGLDMLIESFSFLHREEKDVVLVIVGVGQLEEKLKKLCKHLMVNQSVFFVGSIPHNEIPLYLAMADVFVTTSYREGHPKALIEAMSAEKPIVATRVPGIEDVLEDGKTAILVEAGNPQAVVEALKRLIRDQKLSKHLALNARKKALEDYDENFVISSAQKQNSIFQLFF